MKRLAIILAAVIVLVTGTLIVAPLFIPEELARIRIAEQIEQWIGRPVTFTGEPAISFFPRPTVRLENVAIADGDGSDETFIAVEELTGTVRLLPLLFGRVEVSSFRLERPVIALRVDEDGNTNWTFEGTLGERVNEAFGVGDGVAQGDVSEVALGRFRIVDGTITYAEPGAPLAVISDVSLYINWPSTARAATASGSLTWRGETVDITASLLDPLELIAGRPSRGRFTVDGAPIDIAFDGSVGRNGLDFTFVGQTEVAMGSLRRVIDWAGAPIGTADTLADASIAGTAQWAWPILSFSDATMTLDGNAASGAFTADFSGERVDINGTLALGQLDLTPYADAFLAEVQSQGEDWGAVAISLPIFDHVDADIRISAGRLVVGAMHVENLAASAIAHAGSISLRIGEAGFYGGRVRASLSADYQATRFSAEAEMTLTNVDAQAALTDLVGFSALAGRADGSVTLAADGASWGELVHRLTGTLNATIADGTMTGLDLSHAAAMAAPTVDDIATGAGETVFAVFDAQFSFYGGQLIADRVAATGPDFDLTFAGWGWLTRPEIGGAGLVQLYDRAGSAVRTLPFLMSGTWANPAFADDLGAPGFDPASTEATSP